MSWAPSIRVRRGLRHQLRGPAAVAWLAAQRELWSVPAAPKRRRKLTKRQIARAHRIERRAAVLGVDAPRGHLGQDSGYSPEEYKGWCLNFFDHFVTDRGRVHTAGCTLERPPRTEGEWAGWLARFVFQAYWGS